VVCRPGDTRVIPPGVSSEVGERAWLIAVVSAENVTLPQGRSRGANWLVILILKEYERLLSNSTEPGSVKQHPLVSDIVLMSHYPSPPITAESYLNRAVQTPFLLLCYSIAVCLLHVLVKRASCY
jgi:hypothetical protein